MSPHHTALHPELFNASSSRLFYPYAYEEKERHSKGNKRCGFSFLYENFENIRITTVPSLGASLVKHETSFQSSKTT
jgi:hypothetical protein